MKFEDATRMLRMVYFDQGGTAVDRLAVGFLHVGLAVRKENDALLGDCPYCGSPPWEGCECREYCPWDDHRGIPELRADYVAKYLEPKKPRSRVLLGLLPSVQV